jgi:hypothetical protein
VTALLRYQAGILFRSHRWIFPLIAYTVLISVGAGSSQSLGDGLDFSAAMLLPVAALLTRSMLTAEPPEARACVAAATGPARAQLSALLAALVGSGLLALAGAGYELATSAHVARMLSHSPGKVAATLGAGLGTAVVCAFVGCAVAALFNPPVIRHQATALLGTIAAVVAALASNVSPAAAALRGSGAADQASAWPTGVPLLAAAFLLVVSWALSVWLAARRGS